MDRKQLDQREAWRQRQYEMGLCRKCNTAIFSRQRCFKHWVFEKISKSGLLKGEPTNDNKRRRELLVAYLYSRYNDVVSGRRDAVSEDNANIAAFTFRTRRKVRWNGPKGVLKVGTLIQQIEAKAERDRADAITY